VRQRDPRDAAAATLPPAGQRAAHGGRHNHRDGARCEIHRREQDVRERHRRGSERIERSLYDAPEDELLEQPGEDEDRDAAREHQSRGGAPFQRMGSEQEHAGGPERERRQRGCPLIGAAQVAHADERNDSRLASGQQGGKQKRHAGCAQ
jgi:hypothetical protein